MYRKFENAPIECWRHAGLKLGRARPEICLRAERDGAELLLEALEELAAAGPPARRTLTLRPTSRPRSCRSLRLLHSPESEELRQMAIGLEGERKGKGEWESVVVEFTPAALEELRRALAAWRDGGEDFSVHPYPARGRDDQLGPRDRASGELWFWVTMYP